MPQTQPINSATKRGRKAAAKDKVEATVPAAAAKRRKPPPNISPPQPPPPVKTSNPPPANPAEESKELIAGDADGDVKVDKKKESGKDAAK